jgi:GNAT superfamily N-acetyltransferase
VTACFVIAPAYRGHGIATRLLDQACAQFARDGMETAEGHPATDPESEAGAYRGPLDMYRAAGFQPVDAGDPSCDGARTTVVRRPLT